MVKDYNHALDDAKIAIQLDENYIKVYIDCIQGIHVYIGCFPLQLFRYKINGSSFRHTSGLQDVI
jgi:hypothetical protein